MRRTIRTCKGKKLIRYFPSLEYIPKTRIEAENLGFKQTEFNNYMINASGVLLNFSNNKQSKKLVKHIEDRDGYIVAHIKNNKLKPKTVKIHRLVGKAFVKGYNKDLQINHIDGNKKNNIFTNLEWVNASQNMLHKTRVLGNIPLGEKASRSKLKELDVLNIIYLFEVKNKSKDYLKNKYKVSISQIVRILTGKNWGHLWRTLEPSKYLVQGRNFYLWTLWKISKESLKNLPEKIMKN